MDSEPVAGEPAQIVFRPAGRGGPGVALAAGIPLLLVGVAATVAGLWWAVVVVVLAAWFVLTARQRAVLTDHELTVQGRFTRRSVMLARVTAAAEDRSRTAWVAADDQAPFRVYFVPGGDPGPSTPGTDLFVTEVRRRARAAGAAVDLEASLDHLEQGLDRLDDEQREALLSQVGSDDLPTTPEDTELALMDGRPVPTREGVEQRRPG